MTSKEYKGMIQDIRHQYNKKMREDREFKIRRNERKQTLEEVRDWVILMMPSEIIIDDTRGITGVGSLRELKERLEQKLKAIK